MSASILAANRRHALRIVMWQALTVVAVAILAFVLWNASMALSVLVGGGVGVASTAYMAMALLRQNAQTSARRVAVSFFVGWVIKVVLTIALLWVAFRSKVFTPVGLLTGFVTTFVAFGFSAFRRRD